MLVDPTLDAMISWDAARARTLATPAAPHIGHFVPQALAYGTLAVWAALSVTGRSQPGRSVRVVGRPSGGYLDDQ
jgi:hypothetical protein